MDGGEETVVPATPSKTIISEERRARLMANLAKGNARRKEAAAIKNELATKEKELSKHRLQSRLREVEEETRALTKKKEVVVAQVQQNSSSSSSSCSSSEDEPPPPPSCRFARVPRPRKKKVAAAPPPEPLPPPSCRSARVQRPRRVDAGPGVSHRDVEDASIYSYERKMHRRALEDAYRSIVPDYVPIH